MIKMRRHTYTHTRYVQTLYINIQPMGFSNIRRAIVGDDDDTRGSTDRDQRNSSVVDTDDGTQRSLRTVSSDQSNGPYVTERRRQRRRWWQRQRLHDRGGKRRVLLNRRWQLFVHIYHIGGISFWYVYDARRWWFVRDFCCMRGMLSSVMMMGECLCVIVNWTEIFECTSRERRHQHVDWDQCIVCGFNNS